MDLLSQWPYRPKLCMIVVTDYSFPVKTVTRNCDIRVRNVLQLGVSW
jgi:hypothetical protein